jgi:hypothetical protein
MECSNCRTQHATLNEYRLVKSRDATGPVVEVLHLCPACRVLQVLRQIRTRTVPGYSRDPNRSQVA